MLLSLLIALIPILGARTNSDVLSPAQRHIIQAEKALQASPADASLSVTLAMAMASRARETANPEYYDKGMNLISSVLENNPDDLSAKTARTWILLGQHRFEEALVEAKALTNSYPDSLFVLGTCVDAHVELGHYDEALTAAQWMLDLRPGNVPGLTRASYLRQIFGDITGALELMTIASQRVHPEEVEERAWILVHRAQLSRFMGKLEDAMTNVDEALSLFPNYHYALHERGIIHKEQGRIEEALADFRRHYEVAPHPENLMDVAESLFALRQFEEAEEMFREFERAALRESKNVDNANLSLAEYYLTHGNQLSKAQELMSRERERRGDVKTRVLYARTLSKDQNRDELIAELEFLAGLGYRSPLESNQLGALACAVDRNELADKFYEDALTLSPRSSYGREAAKALTQLSAK